MDVNKLLWEKLWVDMPEYHQEDLMPQQSIKVHFSCDKDREEFSKLVDQKITDKTKSVWYPELSPGTTRGEDLHASDNPVYPVYIISKGRWDTRMTVKALEEINVPYRIVIEPQEYERYSSVIDKESILVLPFSDLGQGSIPARNWVWEHSLQNGDARHWIIDDNIHWFARLNNNIKTRVKSGWIFREAEKFVDRFTNVALAGFNYQFLAKQKQLIPPFILNTRIYSTILIKNDIPYRWRGRYNEDTDLSIRVLKDDWVTVQFNAFLADKQTTMTMKGGNTDELYQGDGRLKMAESLAGQHPDVVRISQKFGRAQHHVDYRPFRNNQLISATTGEKLSEAETSLAKPVDPQGELFG